MSDYKLTNKQVEVVVTGKVVDKDFADILMENTDIPIEDVIILDKVSKKKKITKTEFKHLKNKKLVEGRYPNCLLSKNIAVTLGQKIEYSKLKGLGKEASLSLILEALQTHGCLSKKEIYVLLSDVLPMGLTVKQKTDRIDYFLKDLRMNGKIICFKEGSRFLWKLV